MKDTLPPRVRLGAFEVDLRAGELRQDDAAVLVLPDRPLQILRMLIEADGEIVTREEIRQRLWPNDTIVEFDHSINSAIKKLRRALVDSGDEPHYIGTIAKRGYGCWLRWNGWERKGIPYSGRQRPSTRAKRMEAPESWEVSERSAAGSGSAAWRRDYRQPSALAAGAFPLEADCCCGGLSRSYRCLPLLAGAQGAKLTERTPSCRRLRQHDRRPGLRRHPQAGTAHATIAVALSKHSSIAKCGQH